ncbi:hypothetical protein [Nocardia seriolae]|uniref:HNH endonuclease n=2 Tax=Nocardia seriolae TaxID=37332 RepID=A0A0B8NRH6_9NOCA|nr:hypothetical protein [Nocardia seriolae]MTJ61888.1 hypothetical protein [Nocardia seriolae]MTJ76429.1 hypothetical protein [Nocardia seriolae]MTJ90076.1 hypothetical protein [Nocardia seriolae]MTK34043.1 hypothetical protein [Nocardia seriolae]MTK39840.1 hypothetical protein [Nocardia seriolae]
MPTPSWKDPKLGTMKRVALWLVQEVGVGEMFTKTQLREAFPETSQIDRRMRDLRDFEWRIDTNREDPTLGSHEQRFVTQGAAVWEPGKATRKTGITVTASERHTLLMRDGHKCRSCGIGPGEQYPGTYIASQLDVARRPVRQSDGDTTVELVIECNRCRVGGRDLTADLRDVLARIEQLPFYERKMLADWVNRDARSFSETEALWAAYRTLPADSRDRIRDVLSTPEG